MAGRPTVVWIPTYSSDLRRTATARSAGQLAATAPCVRELDRDGLLEFHVSSGSETDGDSDLAPPEVEVSEVDVELVVGLWVGEVAEVPDVPVNA